MRNNRSVKGGNALLFKKKAKIYIFLIVFIVEDPSVIHKVFYEQFWMNYFDENRSTKSELLLYLCAGNLKNSMR